ncbi:hypothetical protein B0H10DRAFT_379785 [Mycena sp. CBHHK59/15]|nr:hypothetical protein B0H10DRAFT_379785 [Mycena sp. CBHHK59/15]
MAPVVVPGLNVALLTGPLVLGYMWGYCLYGVLVVQVYIYSEAFPNDRPGIKAVVFSMFILESVFTIFMTIAAWNAYGPGWGDIETLAIMDWSWVVFPPLNGILSGMAQSFYIWRIWSLTHKLWLPMIIGCIMLVQVVAVFYFGIVVSIEGRVVERLLALSPEITLWLTGSATCDILITISLVFILGRRKRHTKFQRTTSTINRLIRFCVETGSVTSLGALIEVILWLSCRQWNFHFIPFLVLGKLYSNMLMATLNCRAPMSRLGGDGTVLSGNVPASSFWVDCADKPTHLGSRGGTGVHISRTINIQNDRNTIIMDDFNSNVAGDNKGLAVRDKQTPQLVI